MPWAIKPPASDKDKKSIPLAYILEGEFNSYFADKPVPEKPKKEDDKEKDEGDDKKDKKEKAKEKPVIKESGIKEEKAVLSKGRRGKIFIVGSSEILKDNVVDGEGYSPNAVFVLNTIDYLNNNEGTAVMRSKNQRFNPLKDTKLFTRRFVKFINIGGLPALVIFFGVIIWVRRKARRKVIQTMFKK